MGYHASERTRGQGAKTPRANGKFIKGIGGNPKGRAKIPEGIVELARSNTLLAMKTLTEVCADKKANGTARVMAASIILDRGWGKAVQRTETRSLNVNLAELTDAQLFALLQEMSPGAVLPGLAAPEDSTPVINLAAVSSAGNS